MKSQIDQQLFSDRLDDNKRLLLDLMGNSTDFISRDLKLNGYIPIALFYLEGMVDITAVQEGVISSLLDRAQQLGGPINPETIQQHILNMGEVGLELNIATALDHLLSGSLLLLLEGHCEAVVVHLPGWEDRAISESSTQSVVRGPQNSFNETLRTNTTLVRRRVKDIRVRLKTIQIGKLTKTDVAIMYVDGVADPKLVDDLIRRLEHADYKNILEGEYIEELLLEKKQQTIFPVVYNTDRPDTIAAGMLEAKIAIFIDGTPFVLLVPSLFVDFIQSAEDYYQSYFYSNLIRLLRYTALIICMMGPAIYIALTTYHQDMLPTQLLLSLAAQREGVPFPAFFEALLMEITFEILREAGIRMPRTVGQAVSIVGTIVIGQAAVEASIVSAVMVIVVAITAISSFVIPSYGMSIPIRICRFGFMILAASFGFLGLTVGGIILILHLCSLHSFGVPYMSPYAPYNKSKQSDAILRFPIRNHSNKGEQ
ncbi:spore germination protein [Paenibacillus harenae]|uniref:spore germination protein n=1 Tax=Paenibacillus harenae TaxID=306543 RepID=UPI002794D9EE|nr:spore germination protein [Paenibacillus harenae]MDQ0063842.1 spore germination protein KA [Paenibacillus harenae]